MILPELITLRYPADYTLSQEDIFGSSLGAIFTDDVQNHHGDNPNTVICYQPSNPKYAQLEFRTTDVTGEEQRTKFAHYLWNAGILMAELVSGRPDEEGNEGGGDSGFFETENQRADHGQVWKDGSWWVGREEEKLWSVKGERVLELGAGVGLGGIMSTLSQAERVAITDYPAPPILEAITNNVVQNIPEHLRHITTIEGHQWGDFSTPFATANAGSFTRVLAADCLWMPHEHDSLARSMNRFLSDSPDARVYCIAGFHTGRAKMVPFFEDAVPGNGLEVEQIYEMDANGERRPWAIERDGGREDIGERKKWLVVARLRRRVVK